MSSKARPQLAQLQWIEEILPDEVISIPHRGGFAYYLDEACVLLLIETGASYEHKGIQYPFKIWNGCFFPVEKIKQNTVFAKFQFLENHPVLKDALYLPADSENLNEQVQSVLREIKKRNPLFGTRIKKKRAKGQALISNALAQEIDTSTPRTFGDAPRITKSEAIIDQKVNKRNHPMKKKKISKKKDNDFLLSLVHKRK